MFVFLSFPSDTSLYALQVSNRQENPPRKRQRLTMSSPDAPSCIIHPNATIKHTTVECRQYDKFRRDPEATLRRAAEIREARRRQQRARVEK